MVVITEKHEKYPTNNSDKNMCSNRCTEKQLQSRAGALCHKLGTSGVLKPGTKMSQNMLKSDYDKVTSVQNNPELLSTENHLTFSSPVSKKEYKRSRRFQFIQNEEAWIPFFNGATQKGK